MAKHTVAIHQHSTLNAGRTAEAATIGAGRAVSSTDGRTSIEARAVLKVKANRARGALRRIAAGTGRTVVNAGRTGLISIQEASRVAGEANGRRV